MVGHRDRCACRAVAPSSRQLSPPSRGEVNRLTKTVAEHDAGEGLEGLGVATSGAGLLASDRDRLWTLERLEIADADNLLSLYALGALQPRVLASRYIPELFRVLTDAVRCPSSEEVDRFLRTTVRAAVEGQITEEEIDSLLERVLRWEPVSRCRDGRLA